MRALLLALLPSLLPVLAHDDPTFDSVSARIASACA